MICYALFGKLNSNNVINNSEDINEYYIIDIIDIRYEIWMLISILKKIQKNIILAQFDIFEMFIISIIFINIRKILMNIIDIRYEISNIYNIH